MPKFMIQRSYTPEGVKGLMHDGAIKRREIVTALIEKCGGTVESFHYAFGDADVYVRFEIPAVTAATAISLAPGGA